MTDDLRDGVRVQRCRLPRDLVVVAVPLLRRRHARGPRPARRAGAGRGGLPRPPRPRPRDPPHRRHAQRRRVRPALQPRAAAGGLLRRPHGRRPRAAAVPTTSPATPSTAASPRRRASAPAPTSACRSSSPTARASARSPRWRASPAPSAPEHEQLFGMLARVLAYELERETQERDLRRLNESLRSQARGMAAVARAARALSEDGDPRTRDPRGRLRGRRRTGRLPARAVRPRAGLHRDARRRDGAGHHPGARGDARAAPRARSRRWRATSSPTRSTTRRSPRRW